MTNPTVRAVTTLQERTAENPTAVNYPATVNKGELILMFGALSSSTIVPTQVPSWVDVFRHSVNANSTSPGLAVFAQIAQGTEGGTTYSINHASAVSMWQMIAVQDVDQLYPMPVIGATYDTNAVANPQLVTGITVAAGDLAFYADAFTSTSATATPPTGFTEDGDLTSGTRAGTWGHQAGMAAGATGALSIAYSGGSAKGVGFAFACRGQPATGAIMVQQAKATAGVSSTTQTVTITAPVDGNCLILAASIAGATTAISSISGGGAVWSKVTSNTGGTNIAEVWIGRGCLSGGTTITVTYASAVSNFAGCVAEWSGLVGTFYGTSVGAASSTAVDSAAASVGSAGDIGLSIGWDANSGTLVTNTDTGNTFGDYGWQAARTGNRLQPAWMRATGTTASSRSFTKGTTGQWIAITATFAAATGPRLLREDTFVSGSFLHDTPITIKATRAGDVIILSKWNTQSTVAIDHITGGSGTWTLVKRQATSGAGGSTEIWVGTGLTAGTTSITVSTVSAGVTDAFVANISAWSGLAGTFGTPASATATSTSADPGTVSPAVGDLLYEATGDTNNGALTWAHTVAPYADTLAAGTTSNYRIQPSAVVAASTSASKSVATKTSGAWASINVVFPAASTAKSGTGTTPSLSATPSSATGTKGGLGTGTTPSLTETPTSTGAKKGLGTGTTPTLTATPSSSPGTHQGQGTGTSPACSATPSTATGIKNGLGTGTTPTLVATPSSTGISNRFGTGTSPAITLTATGSGELVGESGTGLTPTITLTATGSGTKGGLGTGTTPTLAATPSTATGAKQGVGTGTTPSAAALPSSAAGTKKGLGTGTTPTLAATPTASGGSTGRSGAGSPCTASVSTSSSGQKGGLGTGTTPSTTLVIDAVNGIKGGLGVGLSPLIVFTALGVGFNLADLRNITLTTTGAAGSWFIGPASGSWDAGSATAAWALGGART